MGKFDQYLIASDLDGTFLGAASSLLDKNLDAIGYFEENGGVFTIATGRDDRVLEIMMPNASDFISCPAILANGSYLFDFRTKTRKNELGLNQEETLFVIRQVKEHFPDVGQRISSERGFLCPHMPDAFKEKMLPFQSIVYQDSLENHSDILWYKLVFVGKPDTIKELTRYLEDLQLKYAVVTTSHQTLVEIIPKDAGKACGLKELKAIYPHRQIICVGDNGNDLDMLSACDIAACPENAIDEVKAISSFHLCHHRDGCIADLIYKLDSSIKE